MIMVLLFFHDFISQTKISCFYRIAMTRIQRDIYIDNTTCS